MYEKPFDPEMCHKGKIKVAHRICKQETLLECYFITAKNYRQISLNWLHKLWCTPRMEYHGHHFQSCSQIRRWEVAQMYEVGKKQERKPYLKDKPVLCIIRIKTLLNDIQENRLEGNILKR